MRIGCVLVPNLAVQVALTNRVNWRSEPVVIGCQPFEGKLVYDVSPAAAACGIKAGMPLYEAYALCPEARFFPANEAKYEQLFEEVEDILEEFSPAVEVEGTGCAYIEIIGTSDELELASNIVSSITNDTGLRARLGVSNCKFVSKVAALTSTFEAPVIVDGRNQRDFLAPYAVDFLPCSPISKEHLHLLGVNFIGQIATFSKDALTSQFGSEGVLIHDLVQGRDERRVTPRRKADVITVKTDVDPPAANSLQILYHCQIMLEKPLASARRRGKACRELVMTLHFDSGISRYEKFLFKMATVSPSTILDRVRVWLENEEFPNVVTELELSILLTAEEGERLRLWREQAGPKPELVKLARNLTGKLGFQPFKRFKTADTKAIFPERRFKLVDLLEEGKDD